MKWLTLLALCACDRYWVCALPEGTGELPQRLSETGLYADLATGELAPGVAAYTPAFELWSDGAAKQRWILLPDRIDSTDPDEWELPPGTKVWKQFSVDGTRIETRLLERRGDEWIALAYAWDPDERDATAAPLGVVDARGTAHDVPAAGECTACHGGRRSFVLGFSAIQLAIDGPELDLADLVAQDLLVVPPPTPTVPGTVLEQAALGYLHANCSHCHNQRRPDRDSARCFDPDNPLDFTLALGELATVDDTATYRTVLASGAAGAVLERIGRRGLFGMPPLATERVDVEATALLRQWIEAR